MNKRILSVLLILCMALMLVPTPAFAADISEDVVFNKQDTYPYNGAPVAFNPACVGIKEWSFEYLDSDGSALEDEPYEPGEYTVIITGYGADCSARIVHSYRIVQEEIEYTASGYSGVYDNQAHSITVNVTTPDVTIMYRTSDDGEFSTERPTFTDAGTYTVYFLLEKENCETVGGSATVTIAKADVGDRVTFNKKDAYDYTGNPVAFDPTCEGITSWSFTYYGKDGAKLSDAPSAPGSYTVEMSGEGANCIAKVTHAYAIDPATFEYTVKSYNGEYDGKAHSIMVNASMSDVVVTYATAKDGAYSATRPMFTDAGTYTVYFRLERTCFKTEEGSATVTIAKADVSDRVTFNKKDAYDYTGNPVAFDPTCEGITSWSFTYYGKDGAKLSDAPSAPGSYTVEMSGEGANCYARVMHAYSISTYADPPCDSVVEYSISGYSGEYDGQPHSITVKCDPEEAYTVKYSKDGGASWQDDNPTFKDAGSYTVFVKIYRGGVCVEEPSATVTITKGTPELYFTPGNIVFQPGEKSRQLEWVYTGDGRLFFTSSDSRHFWVDPSGGLVSLNQEGGVSIWVTAEETHNCKSVSAMCIVETESTLPQIDTKLEYTNTASDLLQQEAKKISTGKGDLILYLDAKLLDPRDPEHKHELHNVRASFTVPYKEILKESAMQATAYDFAVLHQRIDNEIEEVPFIPRAGGLKICDTTLSPFAIVAFPKENYNLYYDVNGGTGTPLNQRVPMYGESYGVAVSSETPSRDGYTFMGWSMSRGGDVQFMPDDTITLDRDIVLCAVWSEKTNTYTVIFDTEGGNTIPDKNVHWSDPVLDGITAPTKNGWELTGWKCGDTPVTENTTYGGLAVNDTTTSITLVAQWKDITVPVISGVENGKTYCDAQTVTVSDNDGIASVTVNGSPVTLDANGQFTLTPATGIQTIVATDNAGNEMTVTVTVNNGHTDENPKDHTCDFCGAGVGVHQDTNRDHNCDYGCSVAIGAHEDTNDDHVCDYGCSVAIGEHKAADGKHTCDYCGAEMTTCKDDDKDHLCDVCGETLSQHSGGKATCVSKAVCEYCGSEYGEIDGSHHNLEGIPATPATVTTTGNKAYWQCKDCVKYFSDPEGKNSISLQDTVTAKLQPEIIEGMGQSLTAGEKKALTFRSNAAFSDFIRVELDGSTLDEKNYTVKEGSTIVTLKADFVGTLSAGEHTIGIVSESGTASTTFTIHAKAANNNDSPLTGDTGHTALWIIILLVSGGLLSVTGVCVRKKKHSEK